MNKNYYSKVTVLLIHLIFLEATVALLKNYPDLRRKSDITLKQFVLLCIWYKFRLLNTIGKNKDLSISFQNTYFTLFCV